MKSKYYFVLFCIVLVHNRRYYIIIIKINFPCHGWYFLFHSLSSLKVSISWETRTQSESILCQGCSCLNLRLLSSCARQPFVDAQLCDACDCNWLRKILYWALAYLSVYNTSPNEVFKDFITMNICDFPKQLITLFLSLVFRFSIRNLYEETLK